MAGVDEAGRGACAGPLVVGAVILPRGRRGRIEGLTDSKLLTPLRRERLYDEIISRAVAWSVLVIPSHDIDRIGVHRCNIAGMRRAVAQLSVRPGYVLSDGFRVPGFAVPTLAVPKGDQAVACIAAASVLAKVTRDRLMCELHERYPAYGFDEHKGYVTRGHSMTLRTYGPCPEHRFSFVNVADAAARSAAHAGRVPVASTGGDRRGTAAADVVVAEVDDLVAAEAGAAGTEGMPGDHEDMDQGVLTSGEGARS